MTSIIQQAVDACGGQSELARRCGVKQGNVWYWLKVGRVPPEHCRAVAAATGHQITVYDLRPDVFGPPSSEPPPWIEEERRQGPPDRRARNGYDRRDRHDRRGKVNRRRVNAYDRRKLHDRRQDKDPAK